MRHKKKLIEVALPLDAINAASAREKSIRHGHPSTLHLWWARRPLAAARAVIFAQMVDDPSEYVDVLRGDARLRRKAESVLKGRRKVWEEARALAERAAGTALDAPDPGPEPTLDDVLADLERQRLFGIIEELVKWENTTNEAVLEKARAEIWQSWRRACKARKEWREERKESWTAEEIARDEVLFNPEKLPGFHDPFAGGGALPLEAQRLGLEAYASDLNPVAVLINKAMIEIPPKFAGKPPVNPRARSEWGGVRSERDALPRDDPLAEGDGRGARSVPARPAVATRGDLRDAEPDHAGGGVDPGQHRGGVDSGIGEGQSPVPGDRPGILGGSGDSVDTVRGPGLVSNYRDGAGSVAAGRGESDVDSDAAKATQELTSHSSLLFPRSYKGAQGLAEDVRYYGQWMRDEAEKRIGHLYPKVKAWRDPRSGRYFGEADVEQWRRSEGRGVKSESGEQAARECGHASLSSLLSTLSSHQLTVIAWLWARTVKSPNPAFAQVDVPLASTFMLSTKKGKEAYVEVVREEERGEREDADSDSHFSLLSPHSSPYRFAVRTGKPKDAAAAKAGTKLSRGANFQCLMSGTPIAPDHIYGEAQAGRMGARLMAIVAEGDRGRVYLAPTPEHEAAALEAKPEWKPEVAMPENPRWFSPPLYGLTTYGDLFTPRQLVALTTFSDLVQEARKRVQRDALAAGLPADPKPLRDGGTGATAYAEAVGVYLAFALSRSVDRGSSICSWDNSPKMEALRNTFGRQAIPMVWDFAEGNPYSESSGNWMNNVEWGAKAVERLPGLANGHVGQADATSQVTSRDRLVSTDPPYYDNIGYADLSDFFYVWLRRSLRPVFPDLFATLAVPKAEELVATPYRHGSKEKAESFFLDGMTLAMHRLADQAHPDFPVTIYYAFKQSETESAEGTASTGWETFLDAVIRAGFAVSGTWPMRTELSNRMIGSGTNALASSIVLVCRPRAADAPTATRREFITALKAELPKALIHLQRGNIAPVDLAQAAIGPGMAVYTRYAKVLDAEGKPLSVREALALINQTLDEALAEQEGDFDADSRWALTWFEQSGFAEGEYGVAEQLSKAKNTSVAGLVEAGILSSKAGKVRLLKPDELPVDWDPANDPRLTAWEMVHHLIRVLEAGGESSAAELAGRLGAKAEVARELCYRLYTVCERKKRAAEALAYNGLVQSWLEIVRLAREDEPERSGPAQAELGL